MTNEIFYLNTENPLELATRLIQEDVNILFLGDKGEYYLVASATSFPVGWSVQERIG